MNSEQLSEFKVFFSWQSDLPEKSNINAIRGALRAACKSLGRKYPATKFVQDEATRGTSGSPNIALKIQEKICQSQAFFADISTITSKRAKRACPNPNVTYELGYASAQLGWDRIVLLFNTAHGKFPGDLPFDVIQQRASPFHISEPVQTQSKKDLATLVEDAIEAIYKMNPKTPVQLRGLSKSEIQHERDVESMQWLMSTLHLPTIQQHLDDVPRCISDLAIHLWTGFSSVYTNKLFSLYDDRLRKLVDEIHAKWGRLLSFDVRYRNVPSYSDKNPLGGRHIFSNPGDAPLSRAQEKDWCAISKAGADMRAALDALLELLRNDYIEVDINNTSAQAWAKIREDIEYINKP